MNIKSVLLASMVLFACLALQAQMPGFGGGKKGSLGLGYGLPYGGLGASADYRLLDNLGITAGFGAFAYSTSDEAYGYSPGYAIGLKYFHGKPDKNWHPQLLLLYGLNGIIYVDQEPEEDIRESFGGFTLGVGSQYMFGKSKKHGFDASLLYVLTSGRFKRQEELEDQGYSFGKVSRFTVSLGYRYAFTLKY
ncbi:MAG: outer membrane beta-barrel protein [Candidatus Cloacimonetes bacterium]|nr:outer membrane beta-barrel protein [Candidatus Cloacimonadota bacterium]